MDDIRLPQHVVDRAQRRWASRFAQQAADRQSPERTPSPESDDPFHSAQVQRLLEGSLKPPVL